MDAEQRQPTHPGVILLEEFLKPSGVTIEQFAEHITTDHSFRDWLRLFCKGKASLMTEVWLWKIAVATGTTTEFWMNLQHEFNKWTFTQLVKQWRRANAIRPMPQIVKARTLAK